MSRSVISSKKENFAGLHFTLNHTGKMSGLHSLSTSVLANPNCERRRANGATICAHCFSAAMANQYKNMTPCLVKNTEILTSGLIPFDAIPVTTTALFRFESFGDLVNWLQVANYFAIARANKQTKFALWTKNPWIISQAIEKGHKKPSNLNIVLSSPFMNRALNADKIKTLFPFIDKIFTVYDPQFIEANKVEINCGARSCAMCRRCYNKNPKGVAIEMVSEKLK